MSFLADFDRLDTTAMTALHASGSSASHEQEQQQQQYEDDMSRSWISADYEFAAETTRSLLNNATHASHLSNSRMISPPMIVELMWDNPGAVHSSDGDDDDGDGVTIVSSAVSHGSSTSDLVRRSPSWTPMAPPPPPQSSPFMIRSAAEQSRTLLSLSTQESRWTNMRREDDVWSVSSSVLTPGSSSLLTLSLSLPQQQQEDDEEHWCLIHCVQLADDVDDTNMFLQVGHDLLLPWPPIATSTTTRTMVPTQSNRATTCCQLSEEELYRRACDVWMTLYGHNDDRNPTAEEMRVIMWQQADAWNQCQRERQSNDCTGFWLATTAAVVAGVLLQRCR